MNGCKKILLKQALLQKNKNKTQKKYNCKQVKIVKFWCNKWKKIIKFKIKQFHPKCLKKNRLINRS